MSDVVSCFVLFRFGWIDEHLAVIPRREAISHCGKNQTGLVTWRAPVTKQFDVFCYNESGKTFLFVFCLALYTTHEEVMVS